MAVTSGEDANGTMIGTKTRQFKITGERENDGVGGVGFNLRHGSEKQIEINNRWRRMQRVQLVVERNGSVELRKP